jgi:hypothetical protein
MIPTSKGKTNAIHFFSYDTSTFHLVNSVLNICRMTAFDVQLLKIARWSKVKGGDG